MSGNYEPLHVINKEQGNVNDGNSIDDVSAEHGKVRGLDNCTDAAINPKFILI